MNESQITKVSVSESLTKFLELSDTDFVGLIDKFGEIANKSDPDENLKSLSLKEIPVTKAEAILIARVGIDFFNSGFDLSEAEEKASTLIENYSLAEENDKKFATYQQRLTKLIHTFSPFEKISSAKEAMYEHERNFTSATIYPELRPIFTHDNTPQVSALACIFDLQLSFFEKGKPSELHLNLDLEDIETLISELVLAKERAESLEAAFQGSSFRTIFKPKDI